MGNGSELQVVFLFIQEIIFKSSVSVTGSKRYKPVGHIDIIESIIRITSMYMAHVCFYVCCSDCVGVCGNVCCVTAIVENGVFSLGVLKYIVCLCRGCDGCCVFCLYCEAWSCKSSCMGSVSVLSCRCCMFVSCVHPVAVLNAAFCMTCNVLILVADARS